MLYQYRRLKPAIRSMPALTLIEGKWPCSQPDDMPFEASRPRSLPWLQALAHSGQTSCWKSRTVPGTFSNSLLRGLTARSSSTTTGDPRHRVGLSFDVAESTTGAVQAGTYHVQLDGVTLAVRGPWELSWGVAGP